GTRKHQLSAAAFATVLLVLSGQAVMSNGFSGRYPDAVVRDDAVRRAEIPWLQCEKGAGKTLDDLCVIGDASAEPDMLLWGDSHMLAWAPGFDAARKTLGRSAYFAPNSSCPPILDIDQSTDPLCRSDNDDIAGAITNGGRGAGKVSTVVLAAYWKVYFNDTGRKLTSEGYAGSNFQVATPKLAETLDRLT